MFGYVHLPIINARTSFSSPQLLYDGGGETEEDIKCSGHWILYISTPSCITREIRTSLFISAWSVCR